MSLASDPLDQAFPDEPAPAAAFHGDPLDAAFAEHHEEKPKAGANRLGVKNEGNATGFINGATELAAHSILNIPHNAARGVVDMYRRAVHTDTNAPDNSLVEALRPPELSENAQEVARGFTQDNPTVEAIDKNPVLSAVGTPVVQAGQALKQKFPQTAALAGDVGAVAAAGLPLAGKFLRGGAAAADVGDAQAIVDKASAGQSMGAASAATNLAQAHPTIKQAIVDAARRNGGAVNRDAMDAHIEASKNGVDLTKGQATRDPVQYSEEQNNSTHPKIAARLNQQNQQMTDRLDEIRRDAAPTSVHNDAIQNGQAVVDRLKAYDEPIKADIKDKYQALTDANGGNVPIDHGQFLTNVDASLKKGFLTKTAASTPEISEILDHVRSGEPLDFEAFENARTRLAAAQRGGGSAGAAAKIVRNELEQMPLSPEASQLKGLADTARSAAKARFDALERDPAYNAAVEESSQIKRGEPSPLADRFLDKYALGAPKANLDVMLPKLDEEAKGALASHTLNQVRTAAVGRTGSVLPSGYSSAMQKLTPKMESLLPKETIDDLQSLGRVVHNVKVAPPGNSVNYSKSGVVTNAASMARGAAEHVLDAKTGGLYGLGKKILRPDLAAHEKWVNESLKPGAGIDQLNTAP